MSRKGLPVVAVAVCLVFASVALARPARTKSTIDVTDRGSRVEYEGQVTSDPPKPRCIARRPVQILNAGRLVARTRTLTNGSWRVEAPAPRDGDEITARIPKLKIGDRVVCSGASGTFTFQRSL